MAYVHGANFATSELEIYSEQPALLMPLSEPYLLLGKSLATEVAATNAKTTFVIFMPVGAGMSCLYQACRGELSRRADSAKCWCSYNYRVNGCMVINCINFVGVGSIMTGCS